MDDFQYHGDELYCEDVPLKQIAEEVGTPFYCYSHNTLERHFKVFDGAFSETPHIVCFAVKANSNIAILRLFTKLGGGMDIVSGGELFRALKAGADPSKIVYAGVGKTDEEIAAALDAGILMFNVESSQELINIDKIAGEKGKKAKVAIRVNPDVDPKTHPYISTGLKTSKFGMSIKTAVEEFKQANALPNIDVAGVHKHIGSQITQTGPFVDALTKTIDLVKTLRAEGVDIRYLDIGGGLGITYKDEAPPHPSDLAREIVPVLKNSGCTIIFEPGRVIVGNAGVLVSKVLYVKSNEQKNFFVVDAAMNDLARPSLYQSYQGIVPLKRLPETESGKVSADVVGPICESGDFLAKDRMLPQLKRGDIIAIRSAGAYGFTMSSNYNSRRRVPEVLVRGKEYHVIRARETFDDLVRGEAIPGFLD